MYVGNHNAKFVVLKRINRPNVFYIANVPGRDPQFTETGKKSFEVVAYTFTEEEAQAIWNENVPKFLLKSVA